MSPNRMPMFLGVDAGGTSCRARLEGFDGKLLGIGVAGHANTRFGKAVVMASIKAACLQAFREAGIDKSKLSETSACIGLAGYSRGGVVDSLNAHPFFQSLGKFEIVSDAQIAHCGAHALNDGGTVIVGTGSVGLATVGRESIRVGGRGFPVSDLGSGAHIGLLAMQQALLAKDGIVGTGPLTAEITGRAERHPLGLQCFIDRCDPTEFATFAPLVVEYAESGDQTSISIMRECAKHINDMLVLLHSFGAPRLCLVGGLAVSISKWIADETREFLSEPLGDPIDGAIAMAKCREHDGESDIQPCTSTLPNCTS